LRSTVAALIVAGALSGCSTTNSGFSKPDLSKLAVGMSRAEVVTKMGKPDSVSIQGRVEYLDYGWDKAFDGVVGASEWYYVRLIDGLVESFGRKGDFGLAGPPPTKIEQTIDQRTREQPGGDLYTELKKLQNLKDDGLITEGEYERLRKRALDASR
jgi:hypothetical protein